MKSSGKALRRILATAKAGTKTPDWLSFGKAVGEVANALGLPHEVAQAKMPIPSGRHEHIGADQQEDRQ
jgi:hypothetical protein